MKGISNSSWLWRSVSELVKHEAEKQVVRRNVSMLSVGLTRFTTPSQRNKLY